MYTRATEQGLLSAIFTNTMSFNGIEEDLIQKTANTPLDQTEPYGVGLFGRIEEVNPWTKKFSVFKQDSLTTDLLPSHPKAITPA